MLSDLIDMSSVISDVLGLYVRGGCREETGGSVPLGVKVPLGSTCVILS